MGSVGAMARGSADRYFQQEVSDLADDSFEIKSKEPNTEKKDNVKK